MVQSLHRAVISSPAPARPLRYIINTSAAPDRIGGNEKIATTGFSRAARSLAEQSRPSVRAHRSSRMRKCSIG